MGHRPKYKTNTVIFLKEKKKGAFHDLGLGKDFSDMTPNT